MKPRGYNSLSHKTSTMVQPAYGLLSPNLYKTFVIDRSVPKSPYVLQGNKNIIQASRVDKKTSLGAKGERQIITLIAPPLSLSLKSNHPLLEITPPSPMFEPSLAKTWRTPSRLCIDTKSMVIYDDDTQYYEYTPFTPPSLQQNPKHHDLLHSYLLGGKHKTQSSENTTSFSTKCCV